MRPAPRIAKDEGESDIGVRLASVCRKATVDKTEGAMRLLVETPHASMTWIG